MIIISIIIFAVLGYYFAVFLKNKKVGYTLSLISIVLFICSLVLLISNEHNHLGMEQKTDQKVYQVQSVQKGSNLLLRKDLGTSGKENVYVYRTPETANAKKPKTTKADLDVKNVVKTGNYDNATLTQKTTRWVYKNGFYSFLFGIEGNNKEFIKQTNTFKVGNDWLVLSTTQAKQLQKKMKSKSFKKQMKQEGEAYVKKAIAGAMQANPQMTSAQQKKVAKQAQKDFQAEAQAKLVKEIQNQK